MWAVRWFTALVWVFAREVVVMWEERLVELCVWWHCSGVVDGVEGE